MTTDRSHSRRQVLQLSGAITTGALTGCLGFLSGSQPTVITNVTVEGRQAVVQIADDTDADAIDLRSPDDELLRTASVGRQSTIEFSLFETTNRPYPPGTYTLVAVATSSDGESRTLSEQALKLTSSLSVTNVHPLHKDIRSDYATANPPPVAGKVQITIKNTGTLPIVIKYVGLPRGVPSPDAPPSEIPTGTFMPVAGAGNVMTTGEQTTFESLGAPLMYAQPPGQTPDQPAVGVPQQGASWEQIKANHCTGTQHTATLLVVPTRGPSHRTAVTFEYSGQTTHHDPLAVDYACTNVSVVRTARKKTPTTQS